MKQQTISDFEYSLRTRKTRREVFLDTMEELIPWEEWVDAIRPNYPKGGRGRPPMHPEKMLRMYLLQTWFHLSDAATEDAIYDSYCMRKFTGIDFLTETVPDRTTLRKFRHLLQRWGLAKAFSDALSRALKEAGYTLRRGSFTDASLSRTRSRSVASLSGRKARLGAPSDQSSASSRH